ncbi:MFS transporter [Phytohabitans sp. ZYX-F-186]|uniref:MFS transporter n=1 Tax=Phytohabitans maris TaxID=3071409 RepID=A0ABU0ZN61_9ACTN|nr:MFS transporter [Phytohabitans sp. ZYX-F-186]MDQ7907700.1 MFS transporter [Phytohabitans sp. ZYX-F-186]
MPEQTLVTARSSATSAPPAGRHRLALAIIVTCQLMLILDATVMNVALPRIADDLHFSSTGLAWVMNSYTLAFGGLLLLGGRAGDLLGRRRLFVAGIALFTVASLAGGFATSAGWLLAARVLQGVGAAMAGPNTIALITTTFTEARERIRALALLSGMASAGFAIGLIVGGVLTEVASWRWVLFINVPFGLAAVLLAPRFVREPERHPARLDLPGALTASTGVAALVYAFIRAAGEGWSDTRAQIAIGAGIALLAAFLLIEVRTREPLLPLRLFADRDRAAGYLNFFLGPAAMMSMFFFLTQFLQDIRGFSALATGLAFLPLAAGMFVVTRLVPHLLPRFGPRPLAVTGAAVMVAGLAWLTRLHGDTGYAAGLLGPMLMLGLGGGLGFVLLTPVIMATVPPRDAGAAGGVLQTMQQTGGTLGLAILVTVFGTATRDASGPPTQTLVHGMTTAFTVAVLIASLTLLVALTFRTRRQPVA